MKIDAMTRTNTARLATAIAVFLIFSGCTMDTLHGMGYDVLRQHDCRQQSPNPETAGCAGSYHREFEAYKQERKNALESE